MGKLEVKVHTLPLEALYFDAQFLKIYKIFGIVLISSQSHFLLGHIRKMIGL